MTSPPPGRRAPVWQLLLGLVISAGLLYLALRGIHFTEVLEYVRRARWAPLLLAVSLATLTFALRIFRWQLLLTAEDGRRLPAGPLWHAIAMGFMANNVLPLRVGEVIRIYAAARLTGTRFTAVLASIAVERLFDAITVVSLLALGVFTTRLPESQIGGFGIGPIASVVGLGALGLLVIAASIAAFPLVAERVVRRLIPAHRIADRIVGMIEGVRQGFSALHSPSRVGGAIVWSFVIWGVSATSFYTMFAAFGIEVNFPGALLMQGLIMFGIALPSTPGYVGAFELPIITLLALYGIDRSQAAAYALTYHVSTFLPITALGAWSLFRTKLGLGDLRRGTV